MKKLIFPPFYLFLLCLVVSAASLFFNISYAVFMVIIISLVSFIFLFNSLKLEYFAEYDKNLKLLKFSRNGEFLFFYCFLLCLNIVNFYVSLNDIDILFILKIVFNMIIWSIIILFVFYLEEVFSTEHYFHNSDYIDKRNKIIKNLKLRNKKFLKTYNKLQKYENYFKKVYEKYIYDSSDYYIFILFKKEEIIISKKQEKKLEKLKKKFEKSFNKLSLS
jgi:hypothetical protein